MATKAQEREIDGLVFEVAQLPAMRANKLLVRLGKVIGPALGKVSKLMQGGAKSIADAELSAVGEAIEALFDKLTPEEFEAVTKELLAGASVTGAESVEDGGTGGKKVPLLPVFDRVMQGRTVTLGKLLAFAFEVNFADFFGVFRGLGDKARAAATAKA